MDAITGAVAIAGLKYVGPAAGEVVKNFLNRVLSPAGDAVGGALAHPIEEWQRRRVERAAAVITDAARLLEAAGTEAQAVPGRILMPLLERASVEDDHVLRERWVRLLAGTATGNPNALPAFVAILSELAPEEVRLLDWLYRTTRGDGPRGIYYSEAHEADVAGTLGIDSGLMHVLVGNLFRLGLVRYPIEVSGHAIEHIIDTRDSEVRGGYSRSGARDFEAMHDEERFWMTDLGGSFVEACSYGVQLPEPKKPKTGAR